MALFPTNHALSQGSLHYRLTTLGYRKYNAYSAEMDISNDCSIFFNQNKNRNTKEKSMICEQNIIHNSSYSQEYLYLCNLIMANENSYRNTIEHYQQALLQQIYHHCMTFCLLFCQKCSHDEIESVTRQRSFYIASKKDLSHSTLSLAD